MTTLSDRLREVSSLEEEEIDHLGSLCRSWQVLADTAFSDLLLYVRVAGEDLYEICAQLRPFTSQTLYPRDLVGARVGQPQQPMVERALREQRIWSQDEPVLMDALPIRIDAIPVRCGSRYIAVVTKEGNPSTSRRPGHLEAVYLRAAEDISRMISEGSFPFPDTPEGEWPRVGDGLLLIDAQGCIGWASPNALSALRRLGVSRNVERFRLDELGFGETGLQRGLTSRRLVDAEIAVGDGCVALRLLPLVAGGELTGALVLVKDITELRRRERVISVKDATIREIHHRVKNNLQTVASLLRLQARRLRSEEAKTALSESVLRIGSIALVHEMLSHEPADATEFSEVVRRIAVMVAEGLVDPAQGIRFEVSGETGPLRADLAAPLAVITTELLQNAVEHAFPDERAGTVAIDVARRRGEVLVAVRDDGVGMADDVLERPQLGLNIVRALVDELGGTFTIASRAGTRAHACVPCRD
jgi:two-component sensor histidine kinase